MDDVERIEFFEFDEVKMGATGRKSRESGRDTRRRITR
jgi:hypothetical protein